MILQEIAEDTEKRIDGLKRSGYYSEIHEALPSLSVQGDFPFEKALAEPGLSIIGELKKASPSRGLICSDFDYESIAAEYEKSGVSAVSCLTEPRWFQGSPEYLRRTAQAVSLPVLRKDFIIDPCQIEEAAVLGASAVLLICALLTDGDLKAFMKFSDSLGLSVLTEVHDEDEIARALGCGARVIGVNNRNLRDFTVDLSTAERLISRLPEQITAVAESGIGSGEDAARMKQAGADAVLVGESLMRCSSRPLFIQELKGTYGQN